MNHLHKMIESYKSGHMSVDSEMTLDAEKANLQFISHHVLSAICFDAGDVVDVLHNFDVLPDIVRLPYDQCWIEFGISKHAMAANVGLICTLCVQDSPTQITIIPFTLRGGSWTCASAIIVKIERGSVTYALPPTSHKWFEAIASAVCKFLSAMNCTNVFKTEEMPSPALNKARLRRGKQPLFSTWTLSISIPKERRDFVALGGSHASPRVHLRRGHPREYKPGLWTWVQPCAVGAKENGMIHKDYKAICKTGTA